MSEKTDKDFIKRLAIEQYHKQFHVKLKEKDLDVRSIDTSSSHDVAYEVFTNLVGDNISLKMHLTVGTDSTVLDNFNFINYKADNITTTFDSSLVATGVLDRHYIDNGTLSLTPLNIDTSINRLILLEQGGSLLLEQGGSFILQ